MIAIFLNGNDERNAVRAPAIQNDWENSYKICGNRRNFTSTMGSDHETVRVLKPFKVGNQVHGSVQPSSLIGILEFGFKVLRKGCDIREPLKVELENNHLVCPCISYELVQHEGGDS